MHFLEPVRKGINSGVRVSCAVTDVSTRGLGRICETRCVKKPTGCVKKKLGV